MRLITVELVDFRSHANTIVHLDNGVTAISGPNGSGKSSIFEAAWFALFGAIRTRTQEEVIRAGERETRVVVDFQVGDQIYSVRRAYRTQGKSGVTRLTFIKDDVDISEPTVAETERVIAEVVGPYHVLAATAYVGQGDGDRFLRARPAERRDVFGAAIPVDPCWNRAQVAAAIKVKALAEAITIKSGQVQNAEYEAQALESLAGERQRLVAQQVVVFDQAGMAEVAFNRLNETRIRAQGLRDAQAQKQERLNEWRWQLGNARPKMREVTTRIETAEDLIANATAIEGAAQVARVATAAYDVAIAEHDDAIAQYRKVLAAWEAEGRHLGENLEYGRRSLVARAERQAAITLAEKSVAQAKQAPSDRCVTCQQILATPEAIRHRDDHVRHLDDRLADARNALLTLPAIDENAVKRYEQAVKVHDATRPQMPVRPEKPDFAEHTKALVRLDLLGAARRSIDGDRKQLAELDAQAKELPGRIETLAAEIKPVEDVGDVQLEEARRRLTSIRSAVAEGEKALAAVNARIQAAEGYKAKAEALAGDLATLRREHEVYTVLAEACGPRGVRQLIADQALVAVQDEANRRLAQLQPGYSVYFSTLSEGGRETLDVGISTPEGLRSYESLSGGEGIRVAIAVRVAMSIVAANMHGLTALPAFYMDEAFGSQDAAGKDAMVECIADLARTVGQVVLVSHDQDFQERFDNRIVLTKERGYTEVMSV